MTRGRVIVNGNQNIHRSTTYCIAQDVELLLLPLRPTILLTEGWNEGKASPFRTFFPGKSIGRQELEHTPAITIEIEIE